MKSRLQKDGDETAADKYSVGNLILPKFMQKQSMQCDVRNFSSGGKKYLNYGITCKDDVITYRPVPPVVHKFQPVAKSTNITCTTLTQMVSSMPSCHHNSISSKTDYSDTFWEIAKEQGFVENCFYDTNTYQLAGAPDFENEGILQKKKI